MLNHYTSINGKIVNTNEAKVSIFDRGFLFGDSIYEVTISQNRRLLFWEEHIERLFNSAKLINLEIQLNKNEIYENAKRLLTHSGIDNAYIRIIVTRGEGEISLHTNNPSHQNVIMIVKEAPFYEENLYTKGIYLNLVSTTRNDKKSLDPNAKSGNYLNNILAIQEAKNNNAYDAIMENNKGEITEGTTFNIWFIKDKQIYTPHPSSGLLKGITRKKLIEFINEEKLNFNETTCSKEDLLNADEVFITSSTKGIMPVYQLNSKVFHDKLAQNSVTKKLMNIYNENVKFHINETSYIY